MEQVQGVAAAVTEPGCASAATVVWAEGVAAPRRRGVPAVSRVLGERGMVSAEWAVGIVAAVAIAGVLLAVVTTGAVQKMLLSIVITVLKTFTKFAG